jgi:hypothetical protein
LEFLPMVDPVELAMALDGLEEAGLRQAGPRTWETENAGSMADALESLPFETLPGGVKVTENDENGVVSEFSGTEFLDWVGEGKDIRETASLRRGEVYHEWPEDTGVPSTTGGKEGTFFGDSLSVDPRQQETPLSARQMRRLKARPRGRQASLRQATGEPDQDYDHEFYDKLVQALASAGFPGAKHREFDKYQGVYLKVPNCGKFWVKDVYSEGQRTDDTSKYKYQSAVLVDEDGEYSANPGDYFMMRPEDAFGGMTLVLTKVDGETVRIEEPKKSDLPDNAVVRPSTFSFEKGTTSEHYMMVEEDDPDEVEMDVVKNADGSVDAGQLIEFCETYGHEEEDI